MLRTENEASILQVQKNLGIRKNSFEEENEPDFYMTGSILDKEEQKHLNRDEFSMTLMSGINRNPIEINKKNDEIQGLKVQVMELQDAKDLLAKERNGLIQEKQKVVSELQGKEVEFKSQLIENENLKKKINAQNEDIVRIQSNVQMLEQKLRTKDEGQEPVPLNESEDSLKILQQKN